MDYLLYSFSFKYLRFFLCKKVFISMTVWCLLLSGCQSIKPSSNISFVKYGSIDDAKGMVELTYTNYDADPKYQNYTIQWYFPKIPSERKFQLCQYQSRCDSTLSVWIDPLWPSHDGIWFHYDLRILLSEGKPIDNDDFSRVKNLSSQTFLEWGKPVLLTSESQYIEPHFYEKSRVTATLRRL